MKTQLNLEKIGILCQSQRQKNFAYEFFKLNVFNLKSEYFYNREFYNLSDLSGNIDFTIPVVGLQNSQIWGCTMFSRMASEKNIIKFFDLFPNGDINKPKKSLITIKIPKWKKIWRDQ